MTVTKLPRNATCRIITVTTKPNQRHTVFLETIANHGLNAPPLYFPLDVYGSKKLQEFSKLGRIHLLVLGLAIMIML